MTTVSSTGSSHWEEKETSSQSKVELLPNENLVKENFSIKRDNYDIYGQLTAPAGYQDHKLPLLILSHGFGNTLEFMDGYAEALAKKGYLVYSFDFVGGSQSSRSGGSMLEMSVFTEQADLNAVLATLKRQDYVDANNIFLAGFSQGGVVSTLVAAEHASDIKGLITMNAAFVLFDDARQLFKSKEDIPAVYNHRGSNLGKVYFENLLDYDIYQTMTKFQKETLIIQGTDDDIVPLSYAERAEQAFPHARLVKIAGAGHILNASQADEAMVAAEAYLKERLASEN
ncbi:alpha/beta hydrolase family protein [Streptococcus oricebi]|nr:alpha/beta fold hydrolase [Streptococcus oricebi]